MTSDSNEEMCKFPYREAIESFMYLTNMIGSDLCYAVNKLSQYVKQPKLKHWHTIKKILKYLKETINYGITYQRDKENNICVYNDTDLAEDIDSKKSTTGYVYLFDFSFSFLYRL